MDAKMEEIARKWGRLSLWSHRSVSGREKIQRRLP